MSLKINFSLAVLVILILTLPRENGNRSEKEPDKIRGVCWVGADSIDYHNFHSLIENHVEWISQTPFGWQPAHDKPELHFGSDQVLWGESDRGIRHTTQLAKQHGLKTILKPHIWLRRGNNKWRSDIHMQSDEEWETWFNNYEAFILHYARLASDVKIEMLCIGTELYHPATRFPERWLGMIKRIREVYNGKLTYAANFHQEFEQITWWDALDYIGIQAYFPLCDTECPTDSELRNGWRPHIAAIERVHQKYDKPVIFTEIGYRNDELAAAKPWLWPSQLDHNRVSIDNDLQARCYEAFYRSCWDRDWMAGVFWWKWHHSTWRHHSWRAYREHRIRRIDSLFTAGRISEDRVRRYKSKIIFSPQDRQAEKIMKKYYRRSADIRRK